MSVTRSVKKLLSVSLHVTLMHVLHQTVLYIPYLCGCKITPQVTCNVMTVKEFFQSLIPGPCLLNEITSFWWTNFIGYVVCCVLRGYFLRLFVSWSLSKEMLFFIKLWQETSPACTIMNQRARTVNAVEAPVVSGQQKIQDTGFRWDANGPVLVHFQGKGQSVTSARYSDMLVNDLKPAVWSKRWELLSKWVLLLHNNAHPIRLHIQWIHYVLWNLRCWNIHLRSRLGAFGLSLVWTYERIFAGPEVCRWWGNGGGAKLVKGHANKPFSRGHPQACRQVDQVCCEAVGLC